MCKCCGATFSTTLEIKSLSSREHWQSFSILSSLIVSGVPHWPLCHIIDRCHHGTIAIGIIYDIILISCHDYPSIKCIVTPTSEKWSVNHLLSSDASSISCLCISEQPMHIICTHTHHYAYHFVFLFYFLSILIGSMKIESELFGCLQHICGLYVVVSVYIVAEDSLCALSVL